MSAAVKNGELKHWSPSQLTTYRRCERRWAFGKIFRPDIVEPPSPGQAIGTKIHGELEVWVDTGQAPESELARVALPLLPDRTTRKLEAEVALKDPAVMAAGVPAKGFIDLRDYTDAGRIELYDYKTRKSLSYALTEDALARDVQMIVYAQHSRLKFGAPEYGLHHIYVRTGGAPAVKQVSATVTPSQIDDIFASIESSVTEMCQSAGAEKPEDVSPNFQACFDFGRPCPYLSVCPGANYHLGETPNTRSNSTMSLGEIIKSRQPRNSGINPPDAAIHPETATATPTPESSVTSSTGFDTPAAVDPLVIYVDCAPHPLPSNSTRLEEVIARHARPIEERHGVSDVREIKFGEGTSALIAAFKRNPPSGTIVASSGGLSSLVVEVLSPLAASVIRSTR